MRRAARRTHAARASHATTVVTRKKLILRRDMRKLWEDHIVWTRLAIISLTTGSPDTEATAVARLTGDWPADVAAFDKIHRHSLHVADLLSAGLVKQFPKHFR